jgi:hypothetical protein
LSKSKKSEPKNIPTVSPGSKILPWAVFIPTVIIVLLSLSSVLFPALLTRATSPFQGVVATPEFTSPVEPGVLAIPLIIVNLIILGIGILYYKKRHAKCKSIIDKISSFEFTKKQALVGVIVLLVIFVAITSGTITKEETWVDYKGVKDRLQTWTISDWSHGFEPHFKYLLLEASLKIFGNIRVIPLITSMALLLLTYFFTKSITQKRFAGIVSMVLLLQSEIFTSYSTTASYDNSWILLYLFGLYLVQKFWPPSPISFILSIFSKALTISFLPMTLYFIVRSTLSKRSKIISLASYGIIILGIIIGVTVLKTNFIIGVPSLGMSQFWQGFSAMAIQMRFDYILVLFLLPVIVMLFFATRRGVLHADSIMIFILSVLLAAPFLLAFTDQTNQPYRFVSLSVFFAIGVGVLLSKKQLGPLSSTQ